MVLDQVVEIKQLIITKRKMINRDHDLYGQKGEPDIRKVVHPKIDMKRVRLLGGNGLKAELEEFQGVRMSELSQDVS